MLAARRRIANQPPGWALTDEGLAALRGVRAADRGPIAAITTKEQSRRADDDDDGEFFVDGDVAPASGDAFDEIDALLSRVSAAAHIRPPPIRRDDSGFVYDEDWDEEARLSEWRDTLKQTESLPPLLAAGPAYEAWETIEPLQRQGWLGAQLVAALLRHRGKTRHHLAVLNVGLRHGKYRRSGRHDPEMWLIGFAQAVETAATLGLKEVERLTLSRELLLRRCVGRRGSSKMPCLVELCLTSPIVSVPFAAKQLGERFAEWLTPLRSRSRRYNLRA